jgi:hypothetical protein
MVAGTTRSGFTMDSNCSKRGSGTEIVPTLGSIVQKGKLADCAFALDKQLNKVDFPTLGKPTIPHFNDIIGLFRQKELSDFTKYIILRKIKK